RRAYLQLRMHVLRAMLGRDARPLPELRRRAQDAAPPRAPSRSAAGVAGARGVAGPLHPGERTSEPARSNDMLNDPIVIVGAARTPMGGFQGDFASLAASDLGAVAIKAAVERAGIAPADVEEVIMGNVLSAGQGQAPARQASIKAGIPMSVGATTVNKMCGSAMKATMLAHDLIAAGTHRVMVAGGMESMSNAPYLMPKARSGYRMGHQTVYDHMFLDGLEDAYDKGRLM